MFWQTSHPKARKRHYCEMCSRIIDPGEVYLRGVGMEDGAVWHWAECAHCEATRGIYDISDDGVYNADMFADWSSEPRDVAELRHAAGYRMRWRTRAGTLLPVPQPSAPPTKEDEHAE